jgi:large subunit GTPase 1
VIASVTQESNLEEFLNTAELAGTTFEAERENFRILPRHIPTHFVHSYEIQFRGESSLVKTEDLKAQSLDELTKKYGHLLRIPRRPKAGTYTTAEELNAAENEAFLEWRKSLAVLTEVS